MLGGGMRQAGVIAAAGIYALKNNMTRIAEDHENARTIAQALAQVKWADVVAALERQGIRSGATASVQIRLVTHMDVSREDTREIARLIDGMRL